MKPKEIRSVAAIIDYRLEALGRNWNWLAQELDVTQGYASHIRTGRRSFSPELLHRVARLLNIAVLDLEFADAVAKNEIHLQLETPIERAAGFELLRFWKTSSNREKQKLQAYFINSRDEKNQNVE